MAIVNVSADINECATRKHVCTEQQTCVNKEGSYACEGPSGMPHDDDLCPRGYTYIRQKRRCEGNFQNAERKINKFEEFLF